VYQELEAPVRPVGSWAPIRDASASDGVSLRGGQGDSLVIRVDGSELQLQLAEGQPAATLAVEVYSDPELKGVPRRSEVVVVAGQTSVDLNLGPTTQSQRVYGVRVSTTETSSLWLDSIRVTYARSYRDVLAMATLLSVALASRLALRRWSRS
jgi:hypothetical protein